MPTELEAAEVTRGYQTQLKVLEGATAAMLGDAWMSLGGYDLDDIADWETLAAPVSEAARAETAAAATGYVAVLLDGPPSPVDVPDDLADPTAPFLRMWHRLAEGDLWEDARTAGVSAAGDYAADLVHSSARTAAGRAGGERIVGWRRVLVGISCEWCALVSTQRYRSAESADFGHRRCDCTVAPIVGLLDPGRVINDDLYRELRAQGVTDRISWNRQATRSLTAADNAVRARDVAVDQLRRETDPARIERLKARAVKHQREAEAFRARAAEEQSRGLAKRLPGTTGYVDPTGAVAPHP